MLGLSWGIWAFWSSFRHSRSLVAPFELLVGACRIQFPDQGWNPSPCIGRMESQPLDHQGACEVTSVVSNSLGVYAPEPARFLCPWDSPGKNTGVGCHFLHQGIFPTQGSNMCVLCLLYRQLDLPQHRLKSSKKLNNHMLNTWMLQVYF